MLLLLRGLLLLLRVSGEDCERGRALLRSFELRDSSSFLLLLKTWLELERRLLLRLLKSV